MDIIVKAAKYFTGLNKKTKRQKRTVSVLSAVVIFMTVQALVLPAITKRYTARAMSTRVEWFKTTRRKRRKPWKRMRRLRKP